MPPKKKPQDRQNRATHDKVVELVPADGPLVVPSPPDRWLPDTVAEWEVFWADEQLVSVVRESHRPALVRLFDWRDRLHRAWALADTLRAEVGDEHFTAGSTGQVKANPLYERAEKADANALAIEARVSAMEDRFGLTPGSLLKLGVDFQRRQSLEAHNTQMAAAIAAASTPTTGDTHHADDPRAG